MIAPWILKKLWWQWMMQQKFGSFFWVTNSSRADGVFELLLVFQRRCPVLVQFQAPSEVCEEAIYFQVCKPINVLLVWILVVVEMQELVLITECVRMHLQHQISPATLNSSSWFNGTQQTDWEYCYVQDKQWTIDKFEQ